MDLRKVKKLIDLVSESGIAELEITEGEETVRISRYGQNPPQTPEYAATLRVGAAWGAFRCCEPLVVNDTTARPAPRTAPQPAPAYAQLIH